jgi:putative flavoprotein involved in K+ transport
MTAPRRLPVTNPVDVEVAVIGAGHAGLATSYYLARAGCPHVVLERRRIAESWRSQRWDSFMMNTPNQYTQLPEWLRGSEDPEAFRSRDAFVAQLENYAARHALPIRCGADVHSVDPDPNGFVITIKGDEPTQLLARAVVVAAGTQRHPHIPTAGTRIDRHVVQLHSSQYRRPADLPDGPVLVVGSAQSGSQITEDLLDAGHQVYLATSRVGRSPRRYRGRDVFDWMVDMGGYETTPAELPDPTQLHAAQPQISGVGRPGHTISLQNLARAGVTLLGHFEDANGRHVLLADDLPDNIRFADCTSIQLKEQIDGDARYIVDRLLAAA